MHAGLTSRVWSSSSSSSRDAERRHERGSSPLTVTVQVELREELVELLLLVDILGLGLPCRGGGGSGHLIGGVEWGCVRACVHVQQLRCHRDSLRSGSPGEGVCVARLQAKILPLVPPLRTHQQHPFSTAPPLHAPSNDPALSVLDLEAG